MIDFPTPRLTRRTVVADSVFGWLTAGLGRAATLPFTPSPAFNVKTWGKLTADLSGRTVFAFTTGHVYGFKPQADDLTLEDFARVLYGYQTCSARKAHERDNGAIAIRQRTWIWYQDPETGAFIDTLINPYTGDSVSVAPTASGVSEQVFALNGPDFSRAPFPVESSENKVPFALDYRVVGEKVFVTRRGFTRFQTPDITWHKLEANLVSHACELEDLTNPDLTHIPSTWSHNLVAEWQTWMNMHSVPGRILFKGNGAHLEGLDQLPKEFKTAVDHRFPGTLTDAASWDG